MIGLGFTGGPWRIPGLEEKADKNNERLGGRVLAYELCTGSRQGQSKLADFKDRTSSFLPKGLQDLVDRVRQWFSNDSRHKRN